MLHLTKGLTENIYFTGVENSPNAGALYDFIFVNRLTEESVTISNQTNTSTTTRFQKVSIVVNTYFANKTTGFYEYSIFDDTDVKVETGLMYLHPSTNFAPTEYTEQVNTFVTYNGE